MCPWVHKTITRDGCLYPPLALFPHTPQITPFTCIIFCTICCQISSSLPLTFFLAEVQCMVTQQMVDMWYVTLFFYIQLDDVYYSCIEETLAIHATCVNILVVFLCFFDRKLLGCFSYISIVFFPGLIASFTAIITEKKGRRGTLALYMTNLVSDTNPCISLTVITNMFSVDDSDKNRLYILWVWLQVLNWC